MEAEDLCAEIASLRQAIHQEESAELDRIAIHLLALKNASRTTSDTNVDCRWHNVTFFSLLGLIISAECQLLLQRGPVRQEDFRQDLDQLFFLAQIIRCECNLTDEIISDVIDFLTALCPFCEEILPMFINRYIPPAFRNVRVTTSAMHQLFIDSVKYYLQNGKSCPAYRLLELLCAYSGKRDSQEQYLQLVMNVLSFLNDCVPEVECRICQEAEPLFKREQTERAGNFYWLYGCCLEKESQWLDAQSCFEKSFSIRQHLYGENDWFTAVAKRESAIIAYSHTDPGDAESYNILLDFMQKMKTHCYNNMPQGQDFVEQLEGRTLYILLQGPQFSVISNPQTYEQLLRRYEEICKQYHASSMPPFDLRSVWNLWGNYYLKTGDFVQAEVSFQKALTSRSPSETLTDFQIKSNLLMVYYVQNDIQRVLPLLNDLLENGHLLSSKDALRIYGLYVGIHLQTHLQMDPEEISDLKDYLQTIVYTLCTQKFSSDSPAEMLTLLVVAVIYFLQNGLSSKKELLAYWNVLQHLDPSILRLGLTAYQCVYFYYCKALLAALLFPEQADVALQKALDSLQRCNAIASTKGAVYEFAASLHISQSSLCLHDASIVLSIIIEEWHSSVRYANNNRLSQFLTLAQILFNGCYSSLRCFLSDQALYEKLLLFKSLASLAGRERNRIIRNGNVDADLVSRISKLQDQMAVLSAQALFHDTEQECTVLATELRQLETSFALRFPQQLSFSSITLSRVLDAIPDNSLVLEYFVTARHSSQDRLQDFIEIDLFILSKKSNLPNLERIVLSEGSSVLQAADTFTQTLQAMAAGTSTIEQETELERLRSTLYTALLKPVIPQLAEGQIIYIAPDHTLTNLPFELLYDDTNILFNHHMVKLECARNFLFYTEVSRGDRSLVIGSPAYMVQGQLSSFSASETVFSRGLLTGLSTLAPLPFAELETQQVAAYLHIIPLNGVSASKQALLDATECSVIHIATHGFFDLDAQTNALYSSCLFFAGAADWTLSGQSSKFFGNGILTADEISRLDLQTVELVVLSSCLNGMNDTNFPEGFRGMVDAFAAAGVQYVIASLWNVADSIGIVLLMEAFYHYYIQEHNSPPIALNKAKHTLMHLTIGQLRQQGWFDSICLNQLSSSVQQSIHQLERGPDQQRPFKNKLFWGGFICYQCNNFFTSTKEKKHDTGRTY